MAVLNPAARTLLEGPALGHLVTLNPDGSPQVTCVWVGLDGDEIVCAHRSLHVKVRNIKRDPRVALSIESEHVDERGMKEYLVVYGHARVTEGGVYELLERLARVYWGPNGPAPRPAPNGYITHITVDRVGGIGPWGQS